MAATAVPLRSRRTRQVPVRPVGDDRLVARVRAGDDAAFEAIYDRYAQGLLAFCRHMLGSRHEAEDALQHSFASAYRALRRGHAEIELRPWLYTIARNRCLSALRSRRPEIHVDGDELEHQALEGLPAQVQRRDELRELVDDLQRLPDDQRAALVLFELGDHSHEEIAEVLDVRREKVKALVFQARAALLRARSARDTSCLEIREQLATQAGALPARSLARTHVDRCPGCAAFERDVRRQRKAFAAILPVVPTVGLKASVLGFAAGGGGGAAALTGGGATAVAGGALAAGGATAGGGSAVAVAGAIGTAGAATVAGGLATGKVATGVAGATAKGLVAKVLSVVAVAGGANEARHVTTDPGLATARSPLVASATIPTSGEPPAPAPAAAAPAAGTPVAPAAEPSAAPAPAKAVPASIPATPAHPEVQPSVAAPPAEPAAEPAPADPAPAPSEDAATPAPDPAPAPEQPSAQPAPAEPTAPAADPAADATPAPPPEAVVDPGAEGSGTTLAAEDPPPAPPADPPADASAAGG